MRARGVRVAAMRAPGCVPLKPHPPCTPNPRQGEVAQPPGPGHFEGVVDGVGGPAPAPGHLSSLLYYSQAWS